MTHDRTRADDEQDEARFEEWNERTKGGTMLSLKEKVKEICVKFTNTATDEEDREFEQEVLQAFSDELERIEAGLPKLIPDRKERERLYAKYPEARTCLADIRNEVLAEALSVITKARKELE